VVELLEQHEAEVAAQEAEVAAKAAELVDEDDEVKKNMMEEKEKLKKLLELQAKEIENVFNAAAHDLRRNTEIFHCIGQFIFDVIGDESSGRILTNDTDDIGKISRRKIGRALPVDDD
jgi:hypothetical protein